MTPSPPPSPPPPPLDDPTAPHPLHCPPLRWGILSCGRVANDFAIALRRHVPSATIVACAASSSKASASSFASRHGILRSYGTYNGLLADLDIDVIYVANVHSFRREIGERCLRAKKHVLLEKPFACSTEDAAHLIRIARECGKFLMEGMWTRFFPAVEHARRIVFGGPGEGGKGILGEVVSVQADFSIDALDNEGEEYPTSFLYNHSLGGGATYTVGPYPLAFAGLFFGSRYPEKIVAVGQVDELTGVDLQASVSLSYPSTGAAITNGNKRTPKLPGCGVASINFGLLGESAEETVVVGTEGRLKILSPAHCPTRLILELKAKGRGQKGTTMEYNYPLPGENDEKSEEGIGYYYPNSAGFAYEAAAVARCIAAGKTEPPQFTLEETLITSKMIDEIRSQLGVKSIGSN